MNPWLDRLNPEQRIAASHNFGPLLILAGAGAGKTTVLVSRAGRLIDEKICPASGLTVLTFTNKAARELKHRVSDKLGKSAEGLWAGTFHSFGLFLLKKFHEEAQLSAHFSILDQSDSESLIKEILKEISVPGKDRFQTDKLLNLVNEWRVNPKKNLIADEDYLAVAEVLLPKYKKRLDILGAVDFESLLLKPLELVRDHEHILRWAKQRCEQLMVDEFQDTNFLQMELIDAIVRPECNITVVGDDDQSVYGWRGAMIQNILSFPKLYKGAQVIKLERNYRSSEKILNLANAVIAKNKDRHGKILQPESQLAGDLPEVFLCESEEEEAEFVVQEIRRGLAMGNKPADICVLFRSNSLGSFLEGTLRRHQIDYKISGTSTLLDRKEVKDCLAYLRCAFRPNDISLKRILNTPARGLGEVSLEKLSHWSKAHKKSFHQSLYHAEQAGLSSEAVKSIKSLLNFIQNLKQRILDRTLNRTAGQSWTDFMVEIGYKDDLFKHSSQAQAAEKRWILVDIIGRILDSFILKGQRGEKTVFEFLDAMELRDLDNEEKDENCVNLMTMHASKGLEFPQVIVVGVEEDIIPHKTLGSDVSEERRLFYVALTRAKSTLSLSYCRTRTKMGRRIPVAPSRFLLEIEAELIKKYESMYRPVSGEQRKLMVADFMANLKFKREQSPKKI